MIAANTNGTCIPTKLYPRATPNPYNPNNTNGSTGVCPKLCHDTLGVAPPSAKSSANGATSHDPHARRRTANTPCTPATPNNPTCHDVHPATASGAPAHNHTPATAPTNGVTPSPTARSGHTIFGTATPAAIDTNPTPTSTLPPCAHVCPNKCTPHNTEVTNANHGNATCSRATPPNANNAAPTAAPPNHGIPSDGAPHSANPCATSGNTVANTGPAYKHAHPRDDSGDPSSLRTTPMCRSDTPNNPNPTHHAPTPDSVCTVTNNVDFVSVMSERNTNKITAKFRTSRSRRARRDSNAAAPNTTSSYANNVPPSSNNGTNGRPPVVVGGFSNHVPTNTKVALSKNNGL